MKLRFAAFTLDTGARQLLKDGSDVHLSPKAFDALALLVERRPAVVRKTELRDRLWPGVHVVDASLTNLIAEIRAAIERPGGPPIVRTSHGVGYAFAAAVDAEPRAGDAANAACWVVWNQQTIALAAGDNVIGRDASSAVWIDGDGVSRRHARIRVAANAEAPATIEDLQSTNGTYLRGRRLEGVERLENGDRIRVGTATLLFRTRSAANAPTKRVRSKD